MHGASCHGCQASLHCRGSACTPSSGLIPPLWLGPGLSTRLEHLTRDFKSSERIGPTYFPEPYLDSDSYVICPASTVASVMSWIQQQQHLTSLYMTSVPSIQYELGIDWSTIYAAITASRKLKELVIDVRGYHYSLGRGYFPQGHSLPNLTKLGFLRSHRNACGDVQERVISACPALKDLTLASGSEFKDMWLDLGLLTTLTGLTSLDLSHHDLSMYVWQREHCEQLAQLTQVKDVYIRGFHGAEFLLQMKELSHLRIHLYGKRLGVFCRD